MAYSYDCRNKLAAAGGPDPLSLKAFTSEFKTGEKRGEDDASSGGSSVSNLKSEAEDEMVGAAKLVKALAERVVQQGTSGSVRINPQRFGSQMSQALSTLFYNAGRASGLSK